MTICDNIRKTLKSYIDDGKSAAVAYKVYSRTPFQGARYTNGTTW